MPFSSNMHIIDSNSHNSSHLPFFKHNNLAKLRETKKRCSGKIRYSISLLDGAACTFNFVSNARSGRRRLTVSESDVKEEGREPA